MEYKGLIIRGFGWTYNTNPSWWRSIVVRPPVLAGELSLSCARLTAGRVTTLWVTTLSAISQPTWPTQPAIPPGSVKWVVIHQWWITKVETYCWLAQPAAGCWVTVQAGVCRLGGDLNGLSFSDEMCVRGVLYMRRAIQIDVFTFFTFLPNRNPNSNRTCYAFCWL